MRTLRILAAFLLCTARFYLPLLPLAAIDVCAQGSVYAVRHAEKVLTDKDEDPPLARAGKKRARDLARALASVRLKAIYVTEYRRTQETAAPVAKAAGLAPVQADSEGMKALARLIRSRHGEEAVLVVGHSDTLPALLKTLGVKDSVAVSEMDYDNLFIVDHGKGGAARMHWLHYGDVSGGGRGKR